MAQGDPITPEQAKNFLPSDEHKQVIDDIYDEAKHWLDGSEITTEAEAEGVERLLEMTRKAQQAADASRAEEKKPFDDAGKEVQKRYKPMLDRADSIMKACRSALTPWRNAIAEKKRLEAEEVARKAQELQERAAAAKRAAGSDLGAQEIAKTAQEDADRIAKNAKRLERNADKGLGLRREYDTVLTDRREALMYYNRTKPAALDELVMQLAREDVRSGKREIPGFTISERKGAF